MGMHEFSTLCNSTELAVHTPLDAVFAEYTREREAIRNIAKYVLDNSNVMEHFLWGATVKNGAGSYTARYLYDEDNAVAALNAAYWNRVMNMTDVLDYMAAKQRNEWNDNIRKLTTPDFNIQDVRDTMLDLMVRRSEFFAQRVDGLFKQLSGDHVTNQPQGFGKRMIIARLTGSYDSVQHDICNYIHDLRVVVGKFMGREVGKDLSTYHDIDRIHSSRAFGQWHSFDGGAWKLRLYKVGTAHLELHPDMSWRLNQILASLYPMAIPANMRKKPVKYKEHAIVTNLISPAVIAQLVRRRPYKDFVTFRDISNLLDETKRVLAYIGGVEENKGFWSFEYSIDDVIEEIVRSGQIPERKTHQFHPTSEALALRAVVHACISEEDEVLEPEAGMGGIAMFLPKARTTCVEISSLHCKVLEARGYHTICTDFLAWNSPKLYDKIVMNPPFSEGRALEHLRKAFSLLKPTGRLVAILPTSLRNKDLFEGWCHQWSETIADSFIDSGTAVSVVILTLSK